MPDALDLLAAQNRIAKAIEDKAATINVAAANPAITVAPASPAITVASALPTINVPPVDLSGVIEAINNLQMSGGGGGTGSFDCNCLALVLKPIVDSINNLRQDMICVIAPVAAATVQIQKTLAYYTEDGPHLGLDAPPGSFIFPRPDDTTPPITSTPPPSQTGEWTTPPVIGGIPYLPPPGGMAGLYNPQSYESYKCDMATYIYVYVSKWHFAIGQALLLGGITSTALEVIVGAVKILNTAMATYNASSTIIYDVRGTVNFVKGGRAVPFLTGFQLALIAFTIGALLALAVAIEQYISDYVQVLTDWKEDLICALSKARTISEARTNFMAILYAHPTQMSLYLDKLSEYFLSDELLSHLFACHPDFDPTSIAGIGLSEAGGCVNCLKCTDAEETRFLAPLTNVGSNGQVSVGTLEYNFGEINADLICVDFSTSWVNGSGALEIWIDGVKIDQKGIGAEWPRNAWSFEGIFQGNLTLKLGAWGGFTGAAIAKIYSVSWRNA